jgi:2-C-methyl-D-erythritol 4-phosphate cytidylyltransferase
MKEYVIIVAAGSGSRMKAALPKQFLELNGKPILQHTIERFHQYNPSLGVIVVLNQEYILFWKDLIRTMQFDIQHDVIEGGSERFFSVKNAIDFIGEENGIVGIHDAVRPLVSLRTIENGYEIARQKGNAVPVTYINDSLRQMKDGESAIVDRNQYRIVQTPQCFELSLLRKAFEQPYHISFTDDASVVESFGERIHLVEGNRENIKITTAEDLKMAEALLSK